MVEKNHKNSLQDIRGYEQQIALAATNGELKIQLTEYFIKSMYFSNQNKELPCYQMLNKESAGIGQRNFPLTSYLDNCNQE